MKLGLIYEQNYFNQNQETEQRNNDKLFWNFQWH